MVISSELLNNISGGIENCCHDEFLGVQGNTISNESQN